MGLYVIKEWVVITLWVALGNLLHIGSMISLIGVAVAAYAVLICLSYRAFHNAVAMGATRPVLGAVRAGYVVDINCPNRFLVERHIKAYC